MTSMKPDEAWAIVNPPRITDNRRVFQRLPPNRKTFSRKSDSETNLKMEWFEFEKRKREEKTVTSFLFLLISLIGNGRLKIVGGAIKQSVMIREAIFRGTERLTLAGGWFSIGDHGAAIDMNFEAYLIAARCSLNIWWNIPAAIWGPAFPRKRHDPPGTAPARPPLLWYITSLLTVLPCPYIDRGDALLMHWLYLWDNLKLANHFSGRIDRAAAVVRWTDAY